MFLNESKQIAAFLGKHIAHCRHEAAEARGMASKTAQLEPRDELERIGQSCAVLAESYEISERIERFLQSRPGADLWLPISGAPFDRELELAVLEHGTVHALAFPCRRIPNGWMNSETKKPVDISPTYWRE